MKRIAFNFLVAIAFGLCAGTFSAVAQEDEVPVTIELQTSHNGKPPMELYWVRLTLTNKQNKPVWYVLPLSGEERIPESGVCLSNAKQPFEANRYAGDEKGNVIEVEMRGNFIAFQVPANGAIVLDGYRLESWKKIDSIEIVQAQEIQVNAKTLLEKWLPYSTLSSEKVTVSFKTIDHFSNPENLDWDAKTMKSRTDYPKEDVATVKMDIVHRWEIKLTEKGDEKKP